ncbi:copper chaperone CopZ [Anaeroplasma bactoclasticum]|uniref:Copper chaperone CopZ n=1 Tax=Anaeroplasma bactoclasticum TaxID=2088 RepID=A0A397S1H4_9MOLU|nr:heavy metal-associated domain-containing protein [Anaeroplasma bactoclasticum]RIA78539.1 copper chaperone CopZ [Anaeroplasma bactoclasticum]
MNSKSNTFTYTLTVLGMKCGMCESHINTTIRNKYKVNKVISKRKKNLTKIISYEEIDLNDLRSLITNLGYTVEDINQE